MLPMIAAFRAIALIALIAGGGASVAAPSVDETLPAAIDAALSGTSPAKFTLVGLDNGTTFSAQHNPKEIAIDKPVAWTQSPTSSSDQPELQFRRAQGRTMSFDLEFDTSADGADVHSAFVSRLVALAMVMDSSAGAPVDKRRPTRVKVTAGAGAIEFAGVIESVETQYTMLLADGTPVRATCAVKIKEASRATFVKP
jgi:hypothetical protein